MKSSIAPLLAAALSLTACAAEPPEKAAARAAAPGAKAAPAAATAETDQVVRTALETLAPGIRIDAVGASPIPGFAEVTTTGRVVYVSNDGKYLLQGSLIRIADRENLTGLSEAVVRRAELAKVGPERRLVFSPPQPKYHVTVFTDIDCGYCRKLHAQMAEYNKLGISIEYLFFPRAGIGSESFDKAVSVWCAADPRQALTDAKAERPVPKKSCPNPVTMDYDLGQRVGVDGTPAMYAADGSQVGGYVEPARLLEQLKKVADRMAAK